MTEILVVDWRPGEFEELRGRFPEVQLHAVDTWDAARPHIPNAEVLVTVGLGFTRNIANEMVALRWMQSMLTGIDHAVDSLSDRPDVLLTSARGIHGRQMTEASIHHMLSLARNVRRTSRNHDAHTWETWDPMVLDGRTVGIVGIGIIGEALARVCKAFGMTVVGVSRSARRVEGIDRMVSRERLAEAASEVDFLVLVLPHDDGSDHIVGREVLRAMKPTAFLVNLARGGVLDTKALVEVLREGAIAGAGLDVFEEEPLPADSPLWDLDNVFITPHMGGRSDRYVAGFLPVFERNLRRWIDGDRDSLENVVAR
jgi:D-2-hydroxyacid dehydrogenase (NADP+)